VTADTYTGLAVYFATVLAAAAVAVSLWWR